MDLTDSPQDAAFRAAARHWIESNRPDNSWRARLDDLDAFLPAARDWQQRKASAGWSCLHWPRAFGGRDATLSERLIWSQEEGELFFMGLPFSVGIGMCAPTLMAYATEAQKERHLPRIASGEEIWCQLFSEPGAGSDLAGIRTRAERDPRTGDWVINGQKIWTSFAQYADYGILLTRSEFDLPKHRGLTYFFVDMHAPGVEVRPIRQASGGADFNEVFLTDVRIPDTQRLGAVGDGWRVAMTTLMNERAIGTAMFPSLFEEMLSLARATPLGDARAIDHHEVGARLADWFVTSNGVRFAEYRMITAAARGQEPGPEASITKLVMGRGRQEMASLMLDLLGPVGALASDPLLPHEGRFHHLYLRSVGNRIEAGTDEILRNIIADRILQLPPDIRVDKEAPFGRISPATR